MSGLPGSSCWARRRDSRASGQSSVLIQARVSSSASFAASSFSWGLRGVASSTGVASTAMDASWGAPASLATTLASELFSSGGGLTSLDWVGWAFAAVSAPASCGLGFSGKAG